MLNAEIARKHHTFGVWVEICPQMCYNGVEIIWKRRRKMLQLGSKAKEILIKTLHIIFIAAGCLLFGYGLLLMIFGSAQKHEIAEAKSHSQPIEVEVTELEHSVGMKHTVIVVLQPTEEHSRLPMDLGKTIATTTNENIAVGDRLTMYYNWQKPQDRIIDFGTAAPMQRLGGILIAVSIFALICVIAVHKICRPRSKPTAVGG